MPIHIISISASIADRIGICVIEWPLVEHGDVGEKGAVVGYCQGDSGTTEREEEGELQDLVGAQHFLSAGRCWPAER